MEIVKKIFLISPPKIECFPLPPPQKKKNIKYFSKFLPLKMSLQGLKKIIIKMSQDELIVFLQYNNFLVPGMMCARCGKRMFFKKYNKVKDKMVWSCTFASCTNYRRFISSMTRNQPMTIIK